MALTISLTIIAAALVVAVIIQIPVLLQIRRTAREMEKFLETARMQIVPLSHDLTVISRELNSVLQSIHRQADKVEQSITTLRDGIGRLREFEEGILHKIEEPLQETATLIGAIGRGIGAFVRMFRR
ncbi:MAG: DUF948 domain-containing protein [Deltaproteobacteria bacterium]|nr:DUF948 domain-containing protein [Deltaproteobacteria bacterium]